MLLRRLVANSNPLAFVDVTLQGFARSYNPEELVGGVMQGDQQVATLNDEIAAAAWPGPPARGDRLVIDGHATVLQGAMALFEGARLIGWNLWTRG